MPSRQRRRWQYRHEATAMKPALATTKVACIVPVVGTAAGHSLPGRALQVIAASGAPGYEPQPMRVVLSAMSSNHRVSLPPPP
jgi:hypothetical protein